MIKLYAVSFTHFRNYVQGSCGRNICECCQCCLTEMQLVYDGCHRFCPNCISVSVIAQTRGEAVAQFLQHQIIQCAYCSLPLDQNVLPALLTKDALKAWQDAMCTAAALESERETELRLRASIEIAQHPDAVLLADIASHSRCFSFNASASLSVALFTNYSLSAPELVVQRYHSSNFLITSTSL